MMMRFLLRVDLAKVEIDKKWGYINKEGKEVVPIKYDDIASFDDRRDCFI